MLKAITAPGQYIQGKGQLNALAISYKKLGETGAYILVDKFIGEKYGAQIVDSFDRDKAKYKTAVFGGECSYNEIEKHSQNLAECDVILGIGGGKTIDTAKAIAYRNNMPVIIVPTAASTDAPCSRLSVIYTDSGEFEAYLPLSKNPDMVIVDTQIIADAPAKFLAAGMGDALATYYEAMACRQSGSVAMSGGHMTLAAEALAEKSLEILFKDGEKAMAAASNRVVTKALENVIEANTYLSGIGFESGGLAAAHAIHNGLTVLAECHNFLHGEKVAFGTVVQLILENRPMEEIVIIRDFCKKVGLPTNLKELGLDKVSDDALIKAAEAACSQNDTMINMPFEVTPDDIFAAMKTADSLL